MNDCRLLRSRQTGVAAVEFALVASIMLLLFMGIFVYWHALQAQQSVTRAAGDGARHVHSLVFESRFKNINFQEAAQTVVEHSLRQSGLGLDHLKAQELASLVTLAQTAQDITVTVTYPIQLFPGDGSNALSDLLGMPRQLQSQSVIQLAH